MVDSLSLAYLKTTELPASDALTTSDLFVVFDPTTGEPAKATGTQVATLLEAGALDPLTVTSTNASALAVGRQGATDPVLKVNASTASVATGVSITGAAAAGGVAVAAISSGTNENLTIDAKGSGTVTVNATGTGNISLARATGVTGAVTVTSAGAAALSVGLNGATNPAMLVDASTASSATGVSVKSAAAAGGVAIAAISSAADEALTINAKGTGTIGIGSISTGAVTITPATTVTGVATLSSGFLSTNASVTPNSGSEAASLIAAGITGVTVGPVTTNADDFIVLPAIASVPFGHTITICCNAGTNFELRTPASSTTTINNVNSDGTQEYLCTDTDIIVVKKHTATGWVAVSYTLLGAVRTAVIPD